MRLGEDHFRVVTGGAHGMADRSGSPTSCPTTARRRWPTTPTRSRRSASGARGRATSSSSLTSDDVSDEGFGFLTCREIEVKGVHGARLADLLRRRARLGAVRRRWTTAAELWETLLEAGAAHGAVPVGIGVYGTTGRIEKGYRAFGYELDAERTIVEAGMQRPKVKAADFVGREAYLAQREAEPARRCSAR